MTLKKPKTHRVRGFLKAADIEGTPVQLQVGGDWVVEPPTSSARVLIAGGIGITPFLSFLRTHKKPQSLRKTTLNLSENISCGWFWVWFAKYYSFSAIVANQNGIDRGVLRDVAFASIPCAIRQTTLCICESSSLWPTSG
jgi:hypothetical protein